MLKFEEYLDLGFWNFGLDVVVVLDFFLDFGLDVEEDFLGEGLGIFGLRAEAKDG
jgi:hypothetical protein